MSSTWSFRIEPFDDELLSSFLIRAAHRHGLTPYRFCAFSFGQSPIWNRDIDCCASDRQLDAISSESHVPYERVQAMTLRSLIAAEHQTDRNEMSPGRAQWINNVGIYHRLRRRYGLRYCPTCLRATACYQRLWRVGFITWCPQHKLPLRDCCAVCGHPIVPHRHQDSLVHCVACGSRLDHLEQPLAPDSWFIEAQLRLQDLVIAAVRGGPIQLGNTEVSGRHFLEGLTAMVRVFQLRSRGQTQHGVCSLPERRPVIDRHRVATDQQVSVILDTLLCEWPGLMQEMCALGHVTQRSFAPMKTLPSWLGNLIDQLPRGRENRRRRTSGVLHRHLRSLRRRRPFGWRTMRARALMRAARDAT